MKKKLYLSLLIIAMLALIIASGCGGNSGITEPATIPDVTNTDNGNTGNTESSGSILVRIKWP